MSTAEGLAKRVRDPLQEGKSRDDDQYDKLGKPAGIAARHKRGVKSLVVAVSIPLVLGIADAVLFSPNQPFYRDLKKPWWNPPGWLFGLAWSLLYPAMGLASWLVWAQGWHARPQQQALALYLLQLVLNLAWPYLFFGRHDPKLALIDISVLAVVLAACIPAFGRVNHVAGNILKPYLAWILFATALNYSIWSMNRGSAHTSPIVPIDVDQTPLVPPPVEPQ